MRLSFPTPTIDMKWVCPKYRSSSTIRLIVNNCFEMSSVDNTVSGTVDSIITNNNNLYSIGIDINRVRVIHTFSVFSLQLKKLR